MKGKALIILLFLAGLVLPIPSARAQASGNQVVVGVLFDHLRERWSRDRVALTSEGTRLNARVLVKSAESNDQMQIEQAKELLNQGAQILLVVPHNLKKAGEIVEIAHQRKVKVIAYDRIIRECDLDFYVSFDNEKVGELEAQYALSQAPIGNYVLLGGSPTDFNAIMIRKGQLKILEPLVQAGKIKIGFDQYTPEWKRENARQNMETAYEKLSGELRAVLCGNDILAGGAISVLEAKGKAGKVIVVAQDAELEALQRIVKGSQAMTIYKPIPKLAQSAMELAIKIVRGEKINHLINKTINNGFKEVPSQLLEPITVDKSNLDATIVQDGLYTRAQIYGQ